MALVRTMAIVAALLLTAEAPVRAAEPAASPKGMQCLKACVDQHGADNRKACALQCGIGIGAGDRKPDCGVRFKACKRACGKDKACRKTCRAARRACI